MGLKQDIALRYQFDQFPGLDKDIIVCNLKGEANSVPSCGRPSETMHLSVIDDLLPVTCFVE